MLLFSTQRFPLLRFDSEFNFFIISRRKWQLFLRKSFVLNINQGSLDQ